MPDVLEVAKRNAVPIYLVMFNRQFQRAITGDSMPARPPSVRAQQDLQRLARSSGGIAFDGGDGKDSLLITRTNAATALIVQPGAISTGACVARSTGLGRTDNIQVYAG